MGVVLSRSKPYAVLHWEGEASQVPLAFMGSLQGNLFHEDTVPLGVRFVDSGTCFYGLRFPGKPLRNTGRISRSPAVPARVYTPGRPPHCTPRKADENGPWTLRFSTEIRGQNTHRESRS